MALLIGVICLAACSNSSNAVPPANAALNAALAQDLTSYLAARASIEHISTLSMSISFRGNPTHVTMAAGTTHYGGGALVTPASLFQTGSNTKAFTAFILLRLEVAGALSIDDTVGEYLPQYPRGATSRSASCST